MVIIYRFVCIHTAAVDHVIRRRCLSATQTVPTTNILQLQSITSAGANQLQSLSRLKPPIRIINRRKRQNIIQLSNGVASKLTLKFDPNTIILQNVNCHQLNIGRGLPPIDSCYDCINDNHSCCRFINLRL
jgi:hypothetical protein